MATCPNINHPDWQKLVDIHGTNLSYYLWDKHEGEVPEQEFRPSKSSPETLNKVKEVAKKMGVDIQNLTDYAKKT